jgi:hypothetical protein
MTTIPSTQTPPTQSRTRNARRVTVAVVTACAAAGPLLLSTSAAAGTPPLPRDTHCPAAYTLLAIAQFDPFYQDPLRTTIDLNGNGLVCALRLPDPVATALDITPPGLPVYLFADDSFSN